MRAVCPGKIILMGDHAAVYKRPAVIATVDLTTEVSVASGEPGVVAAQLDDLGHDWVWQRSQVTETTESARRLWLEYSREPNAERLKRLLGAGDAERLAVLAVGEAARAAGKQPEGVRMQVSSRLPMGAGMGSSASVASAIVAALLAFWQHPTTADELARVILEVERRQHGFPSGIDHEAVIRGGMLWAEPAAGADRLALTELEVSESLQPVVIDTGASRETTGEVVDAVRRTFGSTYEVWDRMESATLQFRQDLEGDTDPRPSVRAYHRCMQEIGVVPDRVAEWIRSWEDAGGAAKVSGAGATSGESAGCVLALRPPEPGSGEPSLPDEWRRLPISIGGPGLQVTPV